MDDFKNNANDLAGLQLNNGENNNEGEKGDINSESIVEITLIGILSQN